MNKTFYLTGKDPEYFREETQILGEKRLAAIADLKRELSKQSRQLKLGKELDDLQRRYVEVERAEKFWNTLILEYKEEV